MVLYIHSKDERGTITMRTIAGLRADRNLKAKDLAKDLNVTPQTIYNWEKNQPDLEGETIIKLCKYFDITSDELLGLNK